MRVGSELKAARKKAGISVEVISKRTKITSASWSRSRRTTSRTSRRVCTCSPPFVPTLARCTSIPSQSSNDYARTFADKDALDALQALDATGALNAKNLADARRSKKEQSNLLRNAAIAAGVVLMAAGRCGAYLHNNGRIAHEVPRHGE